MITGAEALGESGLSYAGRGFDEMTRLAASSYAVWESILDTNADYIAEALQAMLATMPDSMGRPAPLDRLARLLGIEIALGAVILIAGAMLASLPPPVDPVAAPVAANAPAAPPSGR